MQIEQSAQNCYFKVSNFTKSRVSEQFEPKLRTFNPIILLQDEIKKQRKCFRQNLDIPAF